MKRMSKTVFIFVLGAIISFAMNVAAQAVISSGVVSYSNTATSETTVSGALDELFSAVDINSKIGDMSNIEGIGDGTITRAISSQQDSINNLINITYKGFSAAANSETVISVPKPTGSALMGVYIRSNTYTNLTQHVKYENDAEAVISITNPSANQIGGTIVAVFKS